MQYILIDLDGTLINSFEGVSKSIAHAMKYFNVDIEELGQLRKYIGPPLSFSFGDLGLSGSDIDLAIQKYRERYNTIGKNEACLYDGVKDMLSELKKMGKTLILATSKPIFFAKEIVRNFGVSDLLDDVCGADPSVNRNEKSEVIEYIFQKHNIKDKSEVMMLGDTRFDVEGANLCSIPTMGVLWGFGTRESLENEGAKWIAATPEEAVKIISEM